MRRASCSRPSQRHNGSQTTVARVVATLLRISNALPNIIATLDEVESPQIQSELVTPEPNHGRALLASAILLDQRGATAMPSPLPTSNALPNIIAALE